jgi:hypothetical protein
VVRETYCTAGFRAARWQLWVNSGGYRYVCQVKVIRVQTGTVSRALKIFETINDRGIGLDSMDLLKNLLFMKAKQSDYDALRDSWQSFVDLLYPAFARSRGHR